MCLYIPIVEVGIMTDEVITLEKDEWLNILRGFHSMGSSIASLQAFFEYFGDAYKNDFTEEMYKEYVNGKNTLICLLSDFEVVNNYIALLNKEEF